MRWPQLVIYENDGRLAALLRDTAKARDWALREPRRPEACLELLCRRMPGVLVLKVGREPLPELALLERVSWLSPETGTVAVCDLESAALTDLLWDLGAAYVLLTPHTRERLPEIVAGLMGPGDRQKRKEEGGEMPDE